MDPITVITSVAGLLGAAGKVVSALSAVKKSIVDVPPLMDEMLSQVTELEICLSAVQNFLLGLSSAPRGRISMIRVDQLVATLTEAVRTFSELDSLVTSIGTGDGASVKTRLLYVWKEETITRIMLRLDRDKSSLSLMLNITQCESDIAAAHSRDRLQNIVEELLRSNQDISRRLQSLEDSIESGSILTTCFRNGTIDEHVEEEYGAENGDHAQGSLADLAATRSSLVEQTLIENHSRTDFQEDLGASRVYQRTALYNCDISFTSSAVRTHAWSVFSGLSLSEVSVISTIALPLYLDEISNSECYLTTPLLQQNLQKKHQGTVAPIGPGINSQIPKKAPRSRFLSRLNLIRQSNDTPISLKHPATDYPDRSIQPTSPPKPKLKILYKVVVLGDADSGKSTLAMRMTYEGIDEYYITEDAHRKEVIIDGDVCVLEVMEDAGQEGYTALRDSWISEGEAFVLVYSITSRSSFTRVQRYHSQVHRMKDSNSSRSYLDLYIKATPQFYPIILVGNNCHEEASRQVSTQEGSALARELGCEFLEVSVEKDVNVEKAFFDLVRDIRKHAATGFQELN